MKFESNVFNSKGTNVPYCFQILFEEEHVAELNEAHREWGINSKVVWLMTIFFLETHWDQHSGAD